ncbi:MAG: flippase-like domain-containing protein, partial [Planctomycetes bacterium]|nr:flippase-like domain-containing protein [Planctomycetota bacterium]
MEDMDFLAHEMKSAVGAPASVGKGISKWEWLPPIAVAVLAAVYFLTATGSTANRFALFVGLGLVPGSLWRLAGKPSWNIHRLFFALALIIFVLDNPKLRPDAESWLMIKRNWGLVAIGFVISFTQPLWGMLRTHRLLIDGGIVITYFNSLKLCLSGNFFNIFLPGSTGGDAYRVWAITDGYKKRLAPAIASITLDRLLGLPSLILVVVFGMLVDYDFFLQHRMLAGLIPFLAGAGVLCIVLVVYLMFAGKSGRRIASMSEDEASRLGKPPGRLRRMHLRISANIKRPATLPLALFYGFMSHLACIAACQCFGLALNVQGIPMWRYYLIIPLVMTINSIPGAPGGVGQGELAMAT